MNCRQHDAASVEVLYIQLMLLHSIICTNLMGKAFLNVIPLLIFLAYDFARRWPKAGTSCDYINKQVIYNEITVVMTVLFSAFCYCIHHNGILSLKTVMWNAERGYGSVVLHRQ